MQTTRILQSTIIYYIKRRVVSNMYISTSTKASQHRAFVHVLFLFNCMHRIKEKTFHDTKVPHHVTRRKEEVFVYV